MKAVEEILAITSRSLKKDRVNSKDSSLDLTDESRFTLVSKDPFFKKKAKEFGDRLSKLNAHPDI